MKLAPSERVRRPRPLPAPPGSPTILVLVGPTASGKTELGIELAIALGGEIVSADSQQVYQGLEVGTAKPSAGQMQSAQHHLINVAHPSQMLSAGDYQRLADKAIAQIVSKGKLPLVVGGTGLWVRALLQGIADAPTRDDNLRAKLEQRAEKEGREALHAELEKIDPETAATIEPRNLSRIIRAFEIFMLTGKKPSVLRTSHGFGQLRYNARVLGITPKRDELYKRIDARTRAMFGQGLIEEVRALAKNEIDASKGTSPDIELDKVKAFGYTESLAVIRGELTVEQAIEATALKTRHYAKRQLTWFQADPLVEWLPWPVDKKMLIEHLRIGLKI